MSNDSEIALPSSISEIASLTAFSIKSLPAVGPALCSASTAVTPPEIRVASVRQKRAIHIFVIKVPNIGIRNFVFSQNRCAGLLRLIITNAAIRMAAQTIHKYHLVRKLPDTAKIICVNLFKSVSSGIISWNIGTMNTNIAIKRSKAKIPIFFG